MKKEYGNECQEYYGPAGKISPSPDFFPGSQGRIFFMFSMIYLDFILFSLYGRTVRNRMTYRKKFSACIKR